MRGRFPRTLLAALALLVGAPGAPGRALADDGCERCGPQHRVRFTVESARDVDNDWITAVVGITAEDANPAALASRINTEMAWALEQARAESRVKAKSGGYSTFPVREKERIARWQASQQLILEGSDSAALTALVGKLQSRLQLQSFQFSVSEAKRKKVQEELVSEALAAFRARGDLIAKGLGASGYALDDVSVDTGSPGFPVPAMRMEMMAAKDMAAPAVESGTSRVSITVSG